MQVHCPSDASEETRRKKLTHEIDAKYIQAILYTIQARQVSSPVSGDDVPKAASYDKSLPVSPANIKMILYKNMFDTYTDVHRSFQALGSHAKSDPDIRTITEEITQKVIVLSPLAFEAILFLNCLQTANTPNPVPVMVDDLSFTQIIDHTMTLNPPQKIYATFADMILSACSRSSSSLLPTAPNLVPSPTLPITAAINLLGKVVDGVRRLPTYDAPRGAKWIRCMIQVILDGLESRAAFNGGHDVPSAAVTTDATDATTHAEATRNLGNLSTLTDHALLLATSQGDYHYPPEEIQWVATSLFNLAVDMYMSTSVFPLNHLTTISSGPQGEATTPDTPKFWAHKAVEFADLLDVDALDALCEPHGPHCGRGDGGVLARALRERCARFGWEV